ncbi:Pathogenesis-related protein 1-like, SCP domain [Sesbania bispinosa]|nr:Pathogenesis-related protein 1-like, SCP domain [Sesbania bispinosa]
MKLYKVPFFVLCVMVIATTIAHVGYAQDSPADFENAHNAARSQVGVPPLKWDDTVAAYALNYANQNKGPNCKDTDHSNGPYGENLAWDSGDVSGAEAVRRWVDEKANYDYSSNSCDGVCGHYTQVVWRDSVRLGCAKVKCDNNGGTFIICNYDPAGNVDGQKPY